MPIDSEQKAKILKGREAVDAYRSAHTQLHSQPWDRDVPSKHTPLLNELKANLKNQGFNSLDDFFDASEELNIQELGFKDRADFEAKATDTDRKALEEKWH